MAKGYRLQDNAKEAEERAKLIGLKLPDVTPPQATKKPYKRPSNHHKSITIPFDETTYNALIKASKDADLRQTDFIKKAIKRAIKKGLK